MSENDGFEKEVCEICGSYFGARLMLLCETYVDATCIRPVQNCCIQHMHVARTICTLHCRVHTARYPIASIDAPPCSHRPLTGYAQLPSSCMMTSTMCHLQGGLLQGPAHLLPGQPLPVIQ